MKLKKLPLYTSWVYLAVILFIASSCGNTKRIVYLDNITDSEFNKFVASTEPKIQENDLLSITVSSPNATASQFFNTTVSTSTQMIGYSTTQAAGYLVNQDGTIDLPMLGRIKASGYTKAQLKDIITRKLTDNKYLIDPIISIRYLNFKVTVLGEVARPMVINVPDEKINILEALGFAGDMTVYGKRENVALIREEEGKRIVKRLNLNASNILTSPYYYLRPNDIIYVEPNKAKVQSASNTRTWLPALLSGLSLTAVIVDRLTR